MDRITPKFKDVPAAQLFEVAKTTDDNERVMVVIKGSIIEGDEVVKTVALQLGAAGAEARKRLTDAGLTGLPLGGQVQIAQLKFGSRAQKSGFEQGWDIQPVKVPTEACWCSISRRARRPSMDRQPCSYPTASSYCFKA